MLEVKPIFTVAELADATGQSIRVMVGQLRVRGVEVIRSRQLIVTLADLQQRWPALIESLQLAEAARGWQDVA